MIPLPKSSPRKKVPVSTAIRTVLPIFRLYYGQSLLVDYSEKQGIKAALIPGTMSGFPLREAMEEVVPALMNSLIGVSPGFLIFFWTFKLIVTAIYKSF
jgi:hypothetical protein